MTHGIVEMHTRLWSKYLMGRDHLADTGVDVRIIIIFALNNYDIMMRKGFIFLKLGPSDRLL
jgi:hypothetical protein